MVAPPAPAVAPDADKEVRLPWIELLPEEVPALLAGELSGQSWQIVRDPDGAASPVGPEAAAIGDEIRLFRSTEGLGRIAAQSAKQVLYQKVREAERDNIYNEYAPKLGDLITGTVKRFERGDMIVDLGRTEAVIPREHQSRAERYTQGERVRGVLVDVHRNPKGAQVVLSRTAPELLMKLMEMEVPEIYDGTVVIRGCVRQPGDRAKVAVSSRERDVDPVGACVGMRGSRVQAVTNELNGERVDFILWSDNPAQYVINALAPAEVSSIVVDEDKHAMDVVVDEEQLAMAIGRGGQNIRLASELTGWRLNIMSEQAAEEKSEAEQRELRELFMKQLDVDEDVAGILVGEGFSSIEEIAYVPQSELAGIEEFDEAIVQELRNRARDVLLTQAIASEETIEKAAPAADLLEVEGMDDALAAELARHGIVTREDLADTVAALAEH